MTHSQALRGITKMAAMFVGSVAAVFAWTLLTGAVAYGLGLGPVGWILIALSPGIIGPFVGYYIQLRRRPEEE